MLPHPKGEAASIASAFAECAFGISKVDPADLDDYARELLSKLNALIDPIGLRTLQIGACTPSRQKNYRSSKGVNCPQQSMSSQAGLTLSLGLLNPPTGRTSRPLNVS